MGLHKIGDIIPTVRNQVQANNGLTPSKITDDEHAVMQAIQNPKLATVEEEDLKKCLRYLYALVGIRGQNLPVDFEKELLHQYIRTHYGQHSAAEVRMAFDMAVQGKLNVEARCFENFSVAYFASIMNAYRRWADQEVRRVESRIPPPPLPPSPDELLRINLDYAFYLFNLINKLPCKWPKVN